MNWFGVTEVNMRNEMSCFQPTWLNQEENHFQCRFAYVSSLSSNKQTKKKAKKEHLMKMTIEATATIPFAIQTSVLLVLHMHISLSLSTFWLDHCESLFGFCVCVFWFHFAASEHGFFISWRTRCGRFLSHNNDAMLHCFLHEFIKSIKYTQKKATQHCLPSLYFH